MNFCCSLALLKYFSQITVLLFCIVGMYVVFNVVILPSVIHFLKDY